MANPTLFADQVTTLHAVDTLGEGSPHIRCGAALAAPHPHEIVQDRRELLHQAVDLLRHVAVTVTAGGGSGFGLAIVAAIAGAHGGEVRAQSPADGGLVVTVTLPAALQEPRPAPVW